MSSDPSIERTFSSKLRLHPAAADVERDATSRMPSLNVRIAADLAFSCCRLGVETCRPPPEETDVGAAPSMSKGLVPAPSAMCDSFRCRAAGHLDGQRMAGSGGGCRSTAKPDRLQPDCCCHSVRGHERQLMAVSVNSRLSLKAALGRPGPRVERQLLGAAANSHSRPSAGIAERQV